VALLLSPDWFDEASSALATLSPVGDVSALIGYVVSGAPDGKVTFHVVIADGAVRDLNLGKAADPDIVVTLSYSELSEIVAGARSAHSSFMTGGLKVEGDHAAWLTDLQPVRERVLTALQSLTDPAE